MSAKHNFRHPPFWIFPALILVGCHSPAPTQASYSVVASRDIQSKETKIKDAEAAPANNVQYREPELQVPAIKPTYPAKAFAAKAGTVVVGVRLTIDQNGDVINVGRSMFALSTPSTKFDADFRAAIDVAVHQWKYEPARLDYVETVTNSKGFTYDRIYKSERINSEIELEFKFDMP